MGSFLRPGYATERLHNLHNTMIFMNLLYYYTTWNL